MNRRMLSIVAVLACTTAATVSARTPGPEAAMAREASAFLAALTEDQRRQAQYPFNDEERLNWHFIPKDRNGMPLKQLNPAQRTAALALLRSGLSQAGYRKVEAIRELEIILHHMENQSPRRDPDLYFITVFGDPTPDGTWGWRYEGHHCALNWTIARGRAAASTPQFLGTNPGEVRVVVPNAPSMGTRVLGREEDLARALVKSLNPEQRGEAILSDTAPPDIITGAERKASILEHKGVGFRQLNREQQGMLHALVREYADAQPSEIARERLAGIRRAGVENVKFAWMGGLEKNEGHYYRVQGPTFLIEYDNTQNEANHAHCVWRDFKGDFGQDLLALHYDRFEHRNGRHFAASEASDLVETE
jgi:hypothetical protein